MPPRDVRSACCVTDTEYPLVVAGRPTEVSVTMPFIRLIRVGAEMAPVGE